jgi:threonine dehydratase
VTLDDIVSAQRRMTGGIVLTPCTESPALSELTGCRVFAKLDYLQRTGSFKERGARNALLLLNDEQKRRGVVAASAGNHALALAYHGMRLQVPVTVVMPDYAPLIKVQNCRAMKARLIVHGQSFNEAVGHAQSLVQQEGLTYIHGYDDPAVIAGQGTMGLEILEQVPDAQAVIVPIGGAGLIAGVSLAIKSRRPNIRIIGVEASHAASFDAALAAGRPVAIQTRPTLADGLAVNQAGELAFAIARRHVDEVATVSEDSIALAILRLLEVEKAVVEGAAAAPLAALISGKLPHLRGQTIVVTLCGGNIDPSTLARVIELGLAADGRLQRFTASISDRPGGLARFARIIAECGGSVKEIVHDRAFSGPDISTVNIQCTVEARDREHIEKIYAALRAAGIRFAPNRPATDSAP